MNDKIDIEVNIPSEEELAMAYRDKFGVGIPDIMVGITPEGMSAGLIHVLRTSELISPDTEITGLITDIKFTGEDGTLPVGVYIQKAEKSSLN